MTPFLIESIEMSTNQNSTDKKIPHEKQKQQQQQKTVESLAPDNVSLWKPHHTQLEADRENMFSGPLRE